MRGKENRIKGFHSPSSSGKVNLNETCDLPSRSLVTTGENQSPLVSMGFTLGDHIEAGKIARKKGIAHPDVTLCNAIADPWNGHGKRKGIPHPETPGCLLYEILIQDLGGMVLSPVNDRDAWASGHQTFDDLISRRLDPCESEDFHHKRENQGNGLSLVDNRVVERRVMHLHHLSPSFVE
jgi:hypothetical protein